MPHLQQPTMSVVQRSSALKERVEFYRKKGQRIAFVPTMGGLHKGHLSLVKHAKVTADVVIASIFVNPKQFGPTEDFDSYPRDHTTDVAMFEEEGCHVVYIPEVEEIYPPDFKTVIQVPALDGVLCGASRPQFFTGIATVLARLFLQVNPDVTFFGEKDYQQLLIVKQLVKDLGLPITVEGCPIIREQDGLAMSSRNKYLSEEERAMAPALYQEMQKAVQEMTSGKKIESVLQVSKKRLKDLGFDIDYFEVREIASLALVEKDITQTSRLFAAAMLGNTRLIDNIEVSLKS